MEELYPYDKNKDSQHKCLNAIPLDWIETKVKHLFNIGRGRVISQLELNPDGLYPVYSSQTKYDGCLGYINTYDFNVQEMITWTTDGANAGEVFKRSGRFNCTNVCGTLIPKQSLNIDYFHYLLGYMTQFYKRPDTNGAKIMNNEMADIYIVMPSLLEQQKIAMYLDYTTSKIDAIIKQKETLVERFEEKRSAVIHEAVTKGLNPDAPMKDSDIEWLGVVPEHWDISPLKYLTSKIGSGITPTGGANVYSDAGIMFIRSQNVYNEGLRMDDIAYISDEIDTKMSNTRLKDRDILLNITGASIGRCCLYYLEYGMANVNQHVCIIRLDNENANNLFVTYVLQSNYGKTLIDVEQTGANREGLNFEQIKRFVIPLPPIEEQQQIVNFIIEKVEKIEVITSELKTQIDRLKEYRQSVIAEAVTGKVDLRNWQQPLN